MDPYVKVDKIPVSLGEVRSCNVFGPSPTATESARTMRLLSKLLYHPTFSALLSSSFMAFLITTAWTAVIALLATPKKMPAGETCTPSRKTPMRKPKVTMEHARRTSTDGRAARKTKEVRTVKGSTSPRATW